MQCMCCSLQNMCAYIWMYHVCVCEYVEWLLESNYLMGCQFVIIYMLLMVVEVNSYTSPLLGDTSCLWLMKRRLPPSPFFEFTLSL